MPKFFRRPRRYFGYPAVPFVPAMQLLTPADIAYLKDRSLRFAQLVSSDNIGQHPFNSLDHHDGREIVAAITATARFGDDYNYATKKPSIEYNQAKWKAAFDLVNTNIIAWATIAGLYHPVPVPKK